VDAATSGALEMLTTAVWVLTAGAGAKATAAVSVEAACAGRAAAKSSAKTAAVTKEKNRQGWNPRRA
jgi:hypothetical protein